jgi:hypothetical protein
VLGEAGLSDDEVASLLDSGAAGGLNDRGDQEPFLG